MALWAALAFGFTTCGTAWARSGSAAYHLHTGAMVTAARHEPVGSVLRVTNPRNGKSVTVRVNDRGPFSPPGRILDLSTGAFSALFGGLRRGHGPISYSVVSRGGSPAVRHRSRRASKRSYSRSRRYSKSRRSRR
jgi:rare lipoprotein A